MFDFNFQLIQFIITANEDFHQSAINLITFVLPHPVIDSQSEDYMED